MSNLLKPLNQILDPILITIRRIVNNQVVDVRITDEMLPYCICSLDKLWRKFHLFLDKRASVRKIKVIADKMKNIVLVDVWRQREKSTLKRSLLSWAVRTVETSHKVDIPIP